MGNSSQPKRVGSKLPGLRKLGSTGIKVLILGLFDALMLRLLISLYFQDQYALLVSAAVGLILINIVVIVDKAYPYRYLLPGLLFMFAMVVYPIVYNVYISFTNYGTGNILSKSQVIEQIEGRTYSDPDAKKYPFVLFETPNEELLVMLTDSDGALFVSEEGTMVPLGTVDDYKYDEAGQVERIGDAIRLERRDVLARAALLQDIRLDWDGVELKMANFNNFQELKSRYSYLPEEDVIVSNVTNVRYAPVNGYFTSAEGERLSPGFRIQIGFSNYIRLLMNKAISGPFMQVFTWTVVWALLSVVFTFILGLFLAMVLNNPHLHFSGLYRSLLIIPYAIPGFVSALVWRGLLNTDFGQVNRVLEALFNLSIPWLQDPFWAKVGLFVVNLWLGFPYMMIVTLGALQSISPELHEAAYCDGATVGQRLRHITFPLLMTSVLPLLISSFAFNFNNFTLIHLLTDGRPPISGAATPAGSTDILISYTYRLAFEGGRGSDFGLASAVSVLIFILIGTITWFNFRFTRSLEDVGQNV